MIVSHWIILIVVKVSDEVWREKENTRLMLSNFFFSKSRAIYEIMWKSMVEPERSQLKT